MLIIDRFEEGFAICTDTLNCDTSNLILKKDELPQGAKEGDVLIQKDGFYIIDERETEARRLKMSMQLNKLFSKNKR